MRRRGLPSVREEASAKSWRSENDWAIYALVAAVGALTYTNSLNGEFVHDDIPAIVSNRDVNGENPVTRIFKDDFWGTPMAEPHSHKSYRPLTTLTFSGDILAWAAVPIPTRKTPLLRRRKASHAAKLHLANLIP
ncbi:unnamed protein product [Leptosia nina]|uniref:Transmembrane and TPR repeat-containing protein 3 n=1 Tax=Leptosia nina TaxID=320188 RepID=A0AAV1JS94_9NEOP